MAGGKRSAENSIRGYYYQFDYSIIKVLELRNDDDTICIEGIEDVDTTDDNCVAFHQCKCYEGEKYVPSKIAKAIRQMLWHYANNKRFMPEKFGHIVKFLYLYIKLRKPLKH